MNKRPLEGIKVLDFSQVLAAPYCGMLLADLGAEVIKIERPGTGDFSREYGPFVNDISLYFCQYNRGKKGIAIDMRSEEGKKVVMDLVAEVDVVIENFKAGTLDRLGIGYDQMIEVNPQLIYGSVSGFGTYGPLSHLPCMDIIAAARSGLVAQTGMEGQSPIKPGFSLCDTWAGLNMLRGLSMALLEKQRTGKGLRVDIAMLDCAFYMCEGAVLEHSVTGEFKKRTGNHDSKFAPHGQFATKDGNVVIAATKDEDWSAICSAFDKPSLIQDQRFSTNELRLKNRASLIEEVENVTTTLGRYEIEEKLVGIGVAAAAVQTVAEFTNSKQTKEINAITKVNQPGVGEYIAVDTPIKFSKASNVSNAEAPSFPGAHSREVLNRLGYSGEKIEELLSSGAIHQVE